ncbi:LppP/LprE family lipoprotein [Nocardia sp. NPDC057227]|uniref:LppP/LprE family lipoprotein n=1 Tax=Nocardia sp. NPDC057227 TaxID=3346056 RepID=UPI0036357F1B
MTAAVATLGRAGNEAPFLPDGVSDNPLGQCPQLLWARVTAGGSASSPSHILFFDHTGYLGTATQRETSYASVNGATDTTVQVQYRWLLGDEPFCCPQGGPVTITFTLNGRTVTPDRQVPSEVTDPFQPAPGCPVDTATLVTALQGTDIEDRLATPIELEDARCANGWASARSGSHGGTTQPARVLFQYSANAWRPVDVGSAIRCAEYGAPEQLCG